MNRPEATTAITILYVDDVAKSAAFYDRVFALEKTVDVPVFVEYRLNSGARLGLMQRENTKHFLGDELAAKVPTNKPPAAELYLRFDDVSEVLRRLEASGASCVSTLQERDWGDRAAYYLDRDGYVLAVAQHVA